MPETVGDTLLPLVVDEGQPASAEGRVVNLGEEVGLVTDDGLIVESDGAVVSTSLMVRLRLPGSLDLTTLEGRDVAVTGRLRDRRIVVEREDLVSPRPVTTGRPGRVAGGREDTFAGRGSLGGLAVRPEAERELFRAGILLDLWQPDGTDRRVALATDVMGARAVLSELYGDSLEVIQSRWRREELQEIESLFGASDLTLAVGNERGQDLQMKVALTLLHLSSALAARLAPLPAAAISLRVLIRPEVSSPATIVPM